MWFNTAYFSRPSVDTHGQQNSNQLGTVGLNIPVFWGCFLTRAASRGVLSSQPHQSQRRQYIKRPQSREHLFRAIFNPLKTRPFISFFFFFLWGWNAVTLSPIFDLIANCSSKITSKSVIGRSGRGGATLPIEKHEKWLWNERRCCMHL